MAEEQPTALVVEDDELQRLLAATVLEDSDVHVIACESAEAAQVVLEHTGDKLCLIFTDVNLAGPITGAELASIALEKFPNIKVVVTSGNPEQHLPVGAKFIQKPWRAPELERVASEVCHPM